MKEVEPKVFLIGETTIVRNGPTGLQAFLRHIGAPTWKTDAPSGSEELIEVMGRLCYRSFKPGLNANVTRVREGNAVYIENIEKQKHGSVTEHATVNLVFADVSRVFTHEVVRHRAGTAMSQESLRFVRLDSLKGWIPPEFKEDPKVVTIFYQIFDYLSGKQVELAKHFNLDGMVPCSKCTKKTRRHCKACGAAGQVPVPFHRKKAITSAMRRLAPEGLATCIGFSGNHRAWRHLLEYRTADGVEAEMRLAFDKVGKLLSKRYRNIYADFTRQPVEGSIIPAWVPKYSKI